MYTLCAFIITILLVCYILVYSQNLYQEGFDGEGQYGPQYCGDCNSLSGKGMNACLACNNCGWNVDPNGYGTCVLGDQNGPYFAESAQYYYNGGTAAVPYTASAPFGPPIAPWYQRWFLPWYGGFGANNINPNPNYIGNTFYNTDTPLQSARRWRPTGDVRIWGK